MESTATAAGLTAADLLTMLYPACPGWLCLWRSDIKQSKWVPSGDWGEADAYAVRAGKASYDAYFGVCLQDRDYGPGSRGSNETAVAVPGVWIDLDFADKPHEGKLPRKKNYPTREVVEKILASLPIAPSLRIFTGGGIHAYWLFDNPFRINSEADRERIAGVVKSWQGLIKTRLLKAGGYGVDSTFDLARVLRLPGSPHMKHPGLIVDLDPASPAGSPVRYPLATIEKILGQGTLLPAASRAPAANGQANGKPASPVKGTLPAPTVTAANGDGPKPVASAPSPPLSDAPAIYASEASEPPAGRLENMLAASPEFAALWEGRTKRPSPSEYDMSLANFAKNAGWTDQEAAGLLVAFARRQMPDHLPKLLRVTGGIQDYLRLTIDKAKLQRVIPESEPRPANGEVSPARVAGVSLERIGRRIYFIGNAFPIKDQIKDSGGHWDEERKQWWIVSTKEAKAAELLGLPPPVNAKPAAEPATPAVRDAASVAKEFAATMPIESLADQEKIAAVWKSYLGECFDAGLGTDRDALRRLFDAAIAAHEKAASDPQTKAREALEIARRGLGRSDLIEVLKYGRECPEFALVFSVAGKELQVELGQGEALFNHKRIKIQMLISSLCHSIPEWKPKAWEEYATAMIQAARPVETTDGLKEVISIIRQAQAKFPEAQEIEPAEFDEKILGETAHSNGRLYSPVCGKKGEPAVFVHLDRIMEFARHDLRSAIERREISKRLAKLGFEPIRVQGRLDKKRAVRLWRGILPADAAEGD